MAPFVLKGVLHTELRTSQHFPHPQDTQESVGTVHSREVMYAWGDLEGLLEQGQQRPGW